MSEQDPIAAIERRLDRIESTEQIRQLAARYSLALDMRDLDALAGLFPDDVRVGRGRSGRAALRAWFDETLRQQFTGTAHHIATTSSSSRTRTTPAVSSIRRTSMRRRPNG